MNGELILNKLIEEFDDIHLGQFNFNDYEIETTEGDCILVDISVDINELHTKPFYTITNDVDVSVDDEYYTHDRHGEEYSLYLDLDEIKKINKTIYEAIKDRLE